MNNTWEPMLLQYGIPALAVVLAAAISGWWGHRSQRKANEVSAKTAEAAVDDTFTKAYEAADKHWAVYNEGMQRWNQSLQDQINENANQLEQAALRAEADRVARAEADRNFTIAVVYLRRLVGWISDNLPGAEYPGPPPELHLEL